MIRILSFILPTIILLISCQSTTKTEEVDVSATEAIVENMDNEIQEDDPFTYTTKSGKKFVVKIDTTGPFSLQTILISTVGFENQERFHLKEIDPVEDIFLADLNSDGFEEIYITTRSMGSGGYSSLYGYSSNKDKSVSIITIPDLIEMGPDTEGLFEGFSGQNSYSLDEGRLLNTFPIYLPGDSNAQNTGGDAKIYYRLEAGEAGWKLKPLKPENIS